MNEIVQFDDLNSGDIIPSQIEGESGSAYEAFTVWLNLGASRSIASVSDLTGLSPGTLYHHSSDFNWKDRLAQYHEALRKFNSVMALEQREKLASAQFELIGHALEVERALHARLDLDGEEHALREWQKLLNVLHMMLSSVRTDDVQKVAIASQNNVKVERKPYEGIVDESMILEIAARFDKAKAQGDND